MSGGHQYADESDLVISPELQRIVPFCIECKHHKTLRSSHLFHPTELLKSFHAQVLRATERDPFERSPLLVLRGGDLCTYAALPVSAAIHWFLDQEQIPDGCFSPVLHYHYGKMRWIALPWEHFLDLIRFRSNLMPAELPQTNRTLSAPKTHLLLADKLVS
jgi:hypothetical protein